MRTQWWWVVLILPFIWIRPAAGVVALRATSATVAEVGEAADLCVVLDSGGAQVAGTQNDLVWDGACATLASAADCRANPAIAKALHGNLGLVGDFSYRALVLSLSDVDPIPDGELYCCTFGVETAPGSCCSVGVVNTGVSDPSGRELPSSGNTAQLCVANGGVMTTPTPTPNGDPPTSGSSGCQITPPSAGSFGAGVFVLVLLAALRRRARRGDQPRGTPLPLRHAATGAAGGNRPCPATARGRAPRER